MTEKGLAINCIVYITLFCRREKTDWDLHVVHAAYSCNISYQQSIKMTPYKVSKYKLPFLAK